MLELLDEFDVLAGRVADPADWRHRGAHRLTVATNTDSSAHPVLGSHPSHSSCPCGGGATKSGVSPFVWTEASRVMATRHPERTRLGRLTGPSAGSSLARRRASTGSPL